MLLFAAACTASNDPDPKPSTGTAPVTPVFVNLTSEVGIELDPTLTWGSTWVDQDLDGDPDLFANRHWHRPHMFINEGGRYEEADVDLYPYLFDRHQCAWGEANGDGVPDMYCGQGADSGQGSGPNQLLIQGDGLTDRAAQFRVEDRFGRARTANWLDHDSDGDLDLFLGNKLRTGYPNVLFRNDRGVFDPRDLGLAHEVETSATTWADWDLDGDPDLLLLEYEPGGATAFENNDGRFEVVELEGISTESWRASTWGDIDGDGFPDLQMIASDRMTIFRNERGSFEEVSTHELEDGRAGALFDYDNDTDLDAFVVQGDIGSGNARDLLLAQHEGEFIDVVPELFAFPGDGGGESVVLADHDGDGRVDLVTSNGANTQVDNERVRGIWVLWRNQTPGGNWVALDLRGTRWNPLGFGARIRVDIDGGGYWRQINDGVGFRVQSDVGHPVLGIGTATQARVRVEWPDGTNDCLELEAGSTETLQIGSRGC